MIEGEGVGVGVQLGVGAARQVTADPASIARILGLKNMMESIRNE